MQLALLGCAVVPLIVPSLVCVRSLTQPCWHTGLEYPATLHDIVSWCVDINAVPKKAVLRLLAESCSSKVDADRLLLLSSRGGKQAYDEFVGLQRLTLLDLLALFPSSNPSVAHLLSCLPALPPRVYSISSSPLANPNLASIAFTVVYYRTGKDGAIRRYVGLCGACATEGCSAAHADSTSPGKVCVPTTSRSCAAPTLANAPTLTCGQVAVAASAASPRRPL